MLYDTKNYKYGKYYCKGCYKTVFSDSYDKIRINKLRDDEFHILLRRLFS